MSATAVPLDRRVLRLWRIRAGGAVLVAAIALGVLVGLAGGPAAGGAAAAVVVVGAGGLAWWTTDLQWRAWRFEVGDHALHLEHGVLTRHESTIPFHRVQHVDLEAGPLERRLGLTTLVLRTASATSDAGVPGLAAADADDLRARILERVGSGDAT